MFYFYILKMQEVNLRMLEINTYISGIGDSD